MFADLGKLAKNAIFSLHRSDFSEAAAKLARAESLASVLQAIISDEPDLRYGSFSAAMEEVGCQTRFQDVEEARLPDMHRTRCFTIHELWKPTIVLPLT